jgi:polyhydroxyalkanoate synthesis repressor PhaR
MQIIKKYANRKLYHTNRKQYITLEGIATLIQAGEQVQVFDNETGDDITSPILAQVALQGRHSNWPSTGTLSDLIRAGGTRIADVGRSLFTGLGGASLVDAEIARRVDLLLEQESISAEEAERLRAMLLQHTTSDTAHYASSSDVEQLRQQVDALTTLVEQLLNQGKS